MGSTRFPGKVLRTIFQRSLLEIILGKLARVQGVSQIVLVTSKNPENDVLESVAQRLSVPVFRGAEENTLDRFVQAARQFQPDAIVRVTGDCPLIDPMLIEEGIRIFCAKDVDFLGNTKPLTHPHGMQFEITKREALERAWEIQRKRFESYEVFQHADINPADPILHDQGFKKEYMLHEPNLAFIRITIDYPEDLTLVQRVYELLPEEQQDLTHIADLFEKRPELLEINNMHNQKAR